MTLEKNIGRALLENEALAGKLAKYAGEPALFYQQAPGDLDEGWHGKPQYPRLDFTVDRQANPERQSEGSMVLNIWCLDSDTAPEEIEPLVRHTLSMLFFTQDDGTAPASVSWAKSDAFEASGRENTAAVVGVTMQFDVYAYPNQTTSDPDPVQAMNRALRQWCPEAQILGENRLPGIYRPEDERPAFYFRLQEMQEERAIYACTWMTAKLVGHIICPGAAARVRWLKALVDRLAERMEVEMLDGSPLCFIHVKGNSEANCLTTGQLTLAARYGILRRFEAAGPVKEIHTKGGD